MTNVDVVLRGGPNDLPDDQRTHRVPSGITQVKVPHYGGYEHFERGPQEGADGPVEFHWTGRTRVAE